MLGEFVDRIYPIELEIKDTADTDRSASYLDLHLKIDSEGRLRTKLYDKKIKNMLSIKNSSMLMISVSENFLVESEWFYFYKI
jgi:hypothetical protein